MIAKYEDFKKLDIEKNFKSILPAPKYEPSSAHNTFN